MATTAPTNPIDIPPYQIQNLISLVVDTSSSRVTCAQALGTDIYVGCSNGEILRYALSAEPNKPEAYTIFSRLPVGQNGKPIEELVLVPSISRALVLTDQTLHFFVLPGLEPVPYSQMRPLRNIVTFAVDFLHLQRPPPPPAGTPLSPPPVDFCVVKRGAVVSSKLTIVMFALRDKLVTQRELPCPEGVTIAKRIGRTLCAADKTNYNIINLENMENLPVLPLNQVMDADFTGRPTIAVVNESEFLVSSWMGGSTLGLFLNTNGDPVRGTLEWGTYPESISLDWPYVTTLLPNNTIDIHNIETQKIAQVVSATSISPSPSPRSSPSVSGASNRVDIASVMHRYIVPSAQKSDKMKMVKVPLLRGQ